MAEFKTAEQYVVDRLEMLERELDNAKIEHSMEMAKMMKQYEEMCELYHNADRILCILRDYMTVKTDKYFGYIIYTDSIYDRDNPEVVSTILEYFDMIPEDKDDE